MIFSYPAMVYVDKKGAYTVDIPNLRVSVQGSTFLEASERADEVTTGVILFRNLRGLELPAPSMSLSPRTDIAYADCFKTEVCVAEKHYTAVLEE